MDYYYGRSRAQEVALWGGYSTKVMGYGPIAYWPLWEASGSAAVCQVNTAQNGTHTGVTLGQDGIGDGNTCPLFDGSNDYTDIYSATMAAAFSGSQGTVSLWFKMYNAAVWTDGSARYAILLYVDINNFILIGRTSTNNQFRLYYKAGGTIEDITTTALGGNVGWCHGLLTWDKTADQVKGFLNGSQVGATQTGLGTWAGNLDSDRVLIGANDKGPTLVFNGYLAHVATWSSALSATIASDLAVV